MSAAEAFQQFWLSKREQYLVGEVAPFTVAKAAYHAAYQAGAAQARAEERERCCKALCHRCERGEPGGWVPSNLCHKKQVWMHEGRMLCAADVLRAEAGE